MANSFTSTSWASNSLSHPNHRRECAAVPALRLRREFPPDATSSLCAFHAAFSGTGIFRPLGNPVQHVRERFRMHQPVFNRHFEHRDQLRMPFLRPLQGMLDRAIQLSRRRRLLALDLFARRPILPACPRAILRSPGQCQTQTGDRTSAGTTATRTRVAPANSNRTLQRAPRRK